MNPSWVSTVPQEDPQAVVTGYNPPRSLSGLRIGARQAWGWYLELRAVVRDQILDRSAARIVSVRLFLETHGHGEAVVSSFGSEHSTRDLPLRRRNRGCCVEGRGGA